MGWKPPKKVLSVPELIEVRIGAILTIIEEFVVLELPDALVDVTIACIGYCPGAEMVVVKAASPWFRSSVVGMFGIVDWYETVDET